MTRLTDDELRALVDVATPGRRVQFHPLYCAEAKDADCVEWDSSHDTSVILPDGTRYRRYSQHKHAADAALDGLALPLAAEVLELRAEVERLQADMNWLKRSIFGSADYHPSLPIGCFAEMAQTTEAARKGAMARAERAEAALATERESADRLAGNLENCMKVLPVADRRICCSGAWEHCGCMGATVHQEAGHYAREALAAHMKMRGK